MADELKNFKKKKKSLDDIIKLSGDEGIKSNDAGARDGAREFMYGFARKNFFSDDASRTHLDSVKATLGDGTYDKWFVRAADSLRRDATRYFCDNLDGILSESGKALAKNYLALEPVEIEGNDDHNAVVGLHQQFRGIQGLVEGHLKDPQQVPIELVQKTAIDYLKASFSEKAAEADMDSNWIDQDLAENSQLLNLAIYNLSLSREMSVATLRGGLGTLKKKIEKKLIDDKARIAYAERTIKHVADPLMQQRTALASQYRTESLKATPDTDKLNEILSEMNQLYGAQAQVMERAYVALK